jgi:predicted RNA polymerase sigma factor
MAPATTNPPSGSCIEDLLREHAPQVLAAVTRRFGRFDVAEDAVQEGSARRGHPME